MKKCILSLVLLFLLCGCDAPNEKSAKLQISATLFPQYDFAREICGDKAEITLLLPPGMDSHSYEPSPSDMIRISQTDLFLYTGDNMEPWAAKFTENVKGRIVDVSEGALLLDGGDLHSHARHTHADETTDPHIWTNPQNAIVMVDNICRTVCELDPENALFYKENADRYKDALTALDKDIENVVEQSTRKKIIFGGHFAMRYFTERYGLAYTAAFDACNGEAEPSPAVLMQIIKEMQSDEISAVFYEELSTPRTAKLIAEETDAQMLLLHSCHNLSKEEQGETYLSLMRKNLENLKIGLN